MNPLKCIYLALFAVLIMSACTKEENNYIAPEEAAINFLDTLIISSTEKEKEVENILQNYRRIREQNSRSNCSQNLFVPSDYATIQEAVDNICDNGTIMVSNGVYNEGVIIDAPGVSVIAANSVILNGTITMGSNSDGFLVSNFQVNGGFSIYGVNEGTISNNTFNDPIGVNYGVRLSGSTNILISENEMTGMFLGIYLGGTANSPSDNNTIFNNTILNSTFFGGILILGNCNNNHLFKNDLQDNAGNINLGFGILLRGDYNSQSANGDPDFNVIHSNYFINNFNGIRLVGGGQGNQIFENHIESNLEFGFAILGDVINNEIINNTFINNISCDIANFATDRKANIFEENSASCKIGF